MKELKTVQEICRAIADGETVLIYECGEWEELDLDGYLDIEKNPYRIAEPKIEKPALLGKVMHNEEEGQIINYWKIEDGEVKYWVGIFSIPNYYTEAEIREKFEIL